MSHDWVIDVLSDLRRYADRNGLPRLALNLQEAALLAAMEISARLPAAGGIGADGAKRVRPQAADRGD